jgi:hypothetical protein
LLRDELPLHIEGETLLVDPSVEPGTAVSSVIVVHGKVEFKVLIIPAEEDILAGVVEICARDIMPVCHCFHVFFVLVVEVSAGIIEVRTLNDCILDGAEERATLV